MTPVETGARSGINLIIGLSCLLVTTASSAKLFGYVRIGIIAGIPKNENTSMHNIHFITCSNEVDCLELVEGFIEDLVTLETEGIPVYDAHLECEVLLIASVIAVICDNPRASELTSHMGSTARHFCRICMVSII